MATADGERWQRLAGLFDELIELQEGERAGRLAALAAEEPALAAELACMLEGDAADGILDHTLPQPVPESVPTIDRSGERVGPYRLLRLVGRGGMGEVYLAERADGDFRQRVALKLIKRGMDSEALLRRFARERRILAQLEHPHIARLLDGGVAADGTSFLAMEFVDGAGIAEHAQRENLGTRARVELLLQAADAVAHAQSRLVVHRDLKPSNILVGSDGRVRVLDFGIATLLDESEEKLTGTGAQIMSPAYAAPEQVRGEAVTTATDVYALGGVLFELLTGREPHPQRGASPAAWLAALERESAERPSTVVRRTTGSVSLHGETAPERVARELRGDLDTIVLAALHADPARRYAGAAQLAQDLRRWLDGRPIAARPDTAGYRLRKFVARHRLGVGSASAVLLALVAGLGLALWQANVAREHASRADAEAARAQEQAARAESVKQFLSSIFLQVDPLKRDAQGERTLAQAFDEALARIDTEFADDPVTRIDLLDDFGEIRAGQGDFAASQDLFERALALAEATYGATHPAVAESLLNIGVLATYRGNYAEGEAPLRRALAILEPVAESEPKKHLAALSGLAGVLHSQGRHEEVLPILRRVIELRRERDAGDERSLAVDLQNLATALIARGDFTEAAPMVEEARSVLERLHGTGSVALVPVLRLEADVHYQQGDLDAQRRTLQRQAALVREHIPVDHWWKGLAIGELGWVLARDGALEDGMPLIEEAVGIYERLDSPMVVEVTRRAGQAQQVHGNWTAAREWFQRTVDTCDRLPERSETPTCAVVRASLAEAMAHTGAGEAALAQAEQAQAGVVAMMGEESDEHAQALIARAVALEALGRVEEGHALRQQRLALLRRLYGDAHPLVRDVARRMEQRGG